MRICVAQTKPSKADKWLVADRHSTQEWRSLPQSVDVDARRARKRKSCPISLRSDKRLSHELHGFNGLKSVKSV